MRFSHRHANHNQAGISCLIILGALLFSAGCSGSDTGILEEPRIVTVIIQITATDAPTDIPVETAIETPTATKTKIPSTTQRLLNTPQPTTELARSSSIPTLPTSTPAKNVKPTKTLKPTKAAAVPAAAICNCIGKDLDCKDFNRRKIAQDCYNYCKSQGYGDIFRLDGDGDGRVCESLP